MGRDTLKWEYGGYYHNYDMDNEISVGTGTVKVHDIFNELPRFMHSADLLFSDPPCSKSNINSFYTKADIDKKHHTYELFHERFFEVLEEIAPKEAFIEVFKSNRDSFISELECIYPIVDVYESTYYHNKNNKCWVLRGGYTAKEYNINGLDEQDIIEYICKNIDFECIADPCMGQGLVGFYANKYGKKFAGTELNKKRLAVLIERIKRGKI